METPRLSTRITLSALLLVAAGAVALMFLEEARLREVYVSEKRATLAEALHTNKVGLVHEVDTLGRNVLFLANMPSVFGIARAANSNDFDFRDGNTRERWNQRLQQSFTAFLASHPDYHEASYAAVGEGGRELVRVVNEDGRIAAVAPKDLQSTADRAHLRQARELSAARLRFAPADTDRPGGDPVPNLHAMVPVDGPDGRRFGVVAVGVDLRRLLDPHRQEGARGIRTHVGVPGGRYLLHPDGAGEPGARLDLDFPQISPLFDPHGPASFPLQAVATRAGQGYLAAERIHFDAADDSRFLVLAHFVPGDLGAAEAARIPLRRIVEGFAALILVCVIVFFVLRRTFAPLEALTEAAGRIAAGERTPLLPRAGGGEIGRLTGAINAMLTELGHREQEILRINAGLEQQVAERTAALRAVNADLRIAAAAFETHDAIVITDAEGTIIRVNRAFTTITGYEPGEVLGSNPRVMKSGLHDCEFYAAMWSHLRGAGSWAGEITDRRKDGSLYPKWLTITAVKDEASGKTTHYVGIFSDITARKEAEQEIRSLAFYDVLTKLPNRRLFFDRFRAVLKASARHSDYGALFFIDMDRFKLLNDTLGHDYGDLLLIEIAARLKTCVREIDTVARLGGDEFVVLLEAVGHDEQSASYKAGLVAEKIRETLAQPYLIREYEHSSSPSIGVVLFHGSGESAEALLQHADMAMYQAKESGRNTVCFYDPVMQRTVKSRAALEDELREAIAAGQLMLHYQVQVDEAHRPVGAEALLRWHHPRRGLMLPSEFVPLAEDSTLIVEVGQWVLDAACRQLAAWSGNPLMRGLTLAVNLSTRQFMLPGFAARAAGLLRSHGVAPGRLKLEVTEAMVLSDLSNAVAKLHELRALGIRVSMADYGAAYSSLYALEQLPLDQVKIDRGFLRSIQTDPSNAMIVKTMVALARNCHIDVVAEGVETENELARMSESACRTFQGFLFGRPVAVEEFESLLERLAAAVEDGADRRSLGISS